MQNSKEKTKFAIFGMAIILIFCMVLSTVLLTSCKISRKRRRPDDSSGIASDVSGSETESEYDKSGDNDQSSGDAGDIMSISKMDIDDKGLLVITYSDGSDKEFGKVFLADETGVLGKRIKKASVDEKSHLLLKYTDGTSDDAGLYDAAKMSRRPNPTFKISDAAVSDDGTVKVGVSVSSNPGILGMSFSIAIEDDALVLVRAEKAAALPSLSMTAPGKLIKSSPYTFLFDAVDINELGKADGCFLVLTFTVRENTAPGKYRITLSYEDGNIIDNNMQPLDFQCIGGKVTVS